MAPDTTQSTEPSTDTDAVQAITSDDTYGSANSDELQLVTFVVGSEEFAIPILAVQEINRMMAVTRVPQSPAFIEGVINLRGKIIPVMDLRKRFGQLVNEDTTEARIIVVEVTDTAGQDRVIGFTVDRVNEVLRIKSDIVDPPPSMITGVDSEYVEGVGKLDDRLLILLNLQRLFSGEDLDQLAQVASESTGAAA